MKAHFSVDCKRFVWKHFAWKIKQFYLLECVGSLLRLRLIAVTLLVILLGNLIKKSTENQNREKINFLHRQLNWRSTLTAILLSYLYWCCFADLIEPKVLSFLTILLDELKRFRKNIRSQPTKHKKARFSYQLNYKAENFFLLLGFVGTIRRMHVL